MTIQTKLIASLKARGETIVQSRSTKYIVFTRNRYPGEFFYVGKSGALRSGKTITDSYPNETVKRILLAEYDAIKGA